MYAVALNELCDDNLACTENDRCIVPISCGNNPGLLSVVCEGTPIQCTIPSDLNSVCYSAVCTELSGTCSVSPLPQTACDDGNGCTNDRCDAALGCVSDYRCTQPNDACLYNNGVVGCRSDGFVGGNVLNTTTITPSSSSLPTNATVSANSTTFAPPAQAMQNVHLEPTNNPQTPVASGIWVAVFFTVQVGVLLLIVICLCIRGLKKK